jgi:chloramphenicol-sensitive protein RarD
MQAANPRRGYILGLSAYIIWGLFPIYFKLLASVPALEIIVNRAIWSAISGSLLLLVWKHPGCGVSCETIRSASRFWREAGR